MDAIIIKSGKREEMIDITAQIQRSVTQHKIEQGVYFCEFDGPRERKVLVKVV